MAQKKPAPVKKKKRTASKKSNSDSIIFLLLAIATVIIAVCGIYVSANNHSKKRNEITTENSTEQISEGTENGAPSTTAENIETTQTTEAEAETEAATETATQSPGEAAPQSSIGSLPETELLNITDDNWNMTLINIRYRMPDDYTPDLVYVCGSEERLDSRVAPHYEEMYNAAAKDGVYLTPCSGYRSYELQSRNFNREKDYFLNQGYTEDESEVLAAKTIMPPGSSEHNLGLAMDIVCVEEYFEDTDEFAWLNAHAADYGFILRYPEDKQDITKVIYEPWHWRYVGVEKAKEIKASGLVLEEFLGDVG